MASMLIVPCDVSELIVQYITLGMLEDSSGQWVEIQGIEI